MISSREMTYECSLLTVLEIMVGHQMFSDQNWCLSENFFFSQP